MKNKAGDVIHPDFKIYYKTTVIKTVRYWQKTKTKTKKTYIKQWSSIEIPEINSHIYSELISNKGTKNTQWGKDNLFNKWFWENWISICKKKEVSSLSYIIHKNQLKMHYRYKHKT